MIQSAVKRLNKIISQYLATHQSVFILWALVASFGAYFSMYALRKPFTTGLYEGLELWGISYKTILIISQVAGYMVSKFIGIKIISELSPNNRTTLALLLIGIAQLSLLLFGLVPQPYNFIFLFINGLPLGMVFGVLFSYLEGRRVTEIIGMGLGISIIVASGILKTVYIDIHSVFPEISEFWMPFVIGAMFIPIFCLFMWMMSVLPPPSTDDLKNRAVREPMTAEDKRYTIKKYGIPIACYIIVYAMLTTVRDFRDNFAVEIWNEIDQNWQSPVLAKTELIAGFVLLAVIGSVSLIKNNRIGFLVINGIMISGMIIAALATFMFKNQLLTGYQWMLSLGIGTFLAYITAQTILFERMIAWTKLKANAGFFVYLCDSTGYLGSVALLIYRETMTNKIGCSTVLISFVNIQTILGLLLMFICLGTFFGRKTDPKVSITTA